jgi:hypothetical protein
MYGRSSCGNREYGIVGLELIDESYSSPKMNIGNV